MTILLRLVVAWQCYDVIKLETGKLNEEMKYPLFLISVVYGLSGVVCSDKLSGNDSKWYTQQQQNCHCLLSLTIPLFKWRQIIHFYAETVIDHELAINLELPRRIFSIEYVRFKIIHTHTRLGNSELSFHFILGPALSKLFVYRCFLDLLLLGNLACSTQELANRADWRSLS